jgi:hypothetical protein
VLPADDDLLHDLGECQGGDGEVDARHAVGGHGDDDAGDQRSDAGGGECDEEGDALGEEVGVGVGADRQEGAVAEADKPGEADQQHQADAGDRQNEDLSEFADIEDRQQPRRRQHRQPEQAVPEDLAAVLEQTDVVEIGGLEQDAHGCRPQTFLRCNVENSPCGRSISTMSMSR